MAEKQLTHETLGKLDDGAAGLIIDEALKTAIRDCDDRGADGKTRTVEIKIGLVKRENGQVEAAVHVGCKLPAYRTASTVGKLRMDGKQKVKLIFQEYAPEDPDQRTIDEAIQHDGGEVKE